jgi:hypothetical protein
MRVHRPCQQGVLISCGSDCSACLCAAHVQAEVEAVVSLCTADNVDELLAGNPDYVLDAIDNIDTKVGGLTQHNSATAAGTHWLLSWSRRRTCRPCSTMTVKGIALGYSLCLCDYRRNCSRHVAAAGGFVSSLQAARHQGAVLSWCWCKGRPHTPANCGRE